MKKLKTNKKIIFIFIRIIFLLVILVFPPILIVSAQSVELPPPQYDPNANTYTFSAAPTQQSTVVSDGSNSWLSNAITGVGAFLFRLVGTILSGIGRFVLNQAVNIFEAVLKSGFSGRPDFVDDGWKLVRDIANMFFILIMVAIAFATILRIERYGIKELLPKLIIVALLINFSMVLCLVLVDFTNLIAQYFINSAQTTATGYKVNLSAVFIDGLEISRTMTAHFCETYLMNKEDCETKYSAGSQELQNCQKIAQENYDKCKEDMEKITKAETENESLLSIIIAEIGTALILFIAAFILLAGAVLLIIRSIAVWFFVILSPLALICLILPALRTHWERWMHQFTRWCIFAPVYTFFIWLAARMCSKGSLDRISGQIPTTLTDNVSSITQFFADVRYLYNFIFVAGFLIGGLIAANSLGVYGANAAMSLGKRWSNTATGWVKQRTVGRAAEKAKRTAAETGQMYGGAAERIGGKVLQKIPGFKAIGARMEKRGEMRWEKVAESEKMKRREAEYERMSTEQRKMIMDSKTTPSADKLVLAEIMAKKDLHKIDTGTATRIKDSFLAYGRKEDAEEIKKKRPDTIIKRRGIKEGFKIDEAATRQAQINAVKELKDKDKINELLPIAVRQSEWIQEGITQSFTQREAERYAAIDKLHHDAISEAYSKAIDKTLPTDPNREKFENIFSSINVGNVEEIADAEKQKMIAGYAAKYNRLQSLPDKAIENPNIAEGAIKNAPTIEAIKELVKAGKTTAGALKTVVVKLSTTSADSFVQQRAQRVLTALDGSLKRLTKNNFAQFAQESLPQDWEEIKIPDFDPAEFTGGIKEFVNTLIDNIEHKNLVPTLKKTGTDFARPIIKVITDSAKNKETTPTKGISYQDILELINSDPTTKAMAI